MTGRRAVLGGLLAATTTGQALAAPERPDRPTPQAEDVNRPAGDAPLPTLRVWRDPGCGCCGGWIAHMRAAGFPVEENTVPSVAPARRMLGIPADLLSCHAAQLGAYALEGHVPAAAALRLLRERPAGLRGLAVPGMPVGSPGMEVPGQPDDTYEVIGFDGGAGRQVFMRFRGGEPV